MNLRKILLSILLNIPSRGGLFRRLYLILSARDGVAWALYLKSGRLIYKMGDDCYVSPRASITDPGYLCMGNNVRLSDCTILGHDGSVNMINRALGTKLDSVGPVTLKDNVFVGHGAIICPGVSIGPNAIVGAGAVVRRNVNEGEIVIGSPAHVVGRLDEYVAKLKLRNESWPWRPLVESRSGDFDKDLEPMLVEMRQKYFFAQTSD